MSAASCNTPVTVRVPRPGFLARVATRIVDTEGAAKVARSVIVVPDLHATGDVARALRTAVDAPVLLLPRITTLKVWAEEVALARPVLGRAARAALLYRALAERGWFASADLWGICDELGVLFDELTRERATLPATAAAFAGWLGAAYGTKANAPLDFEARLVHAMWSAFTADGTAIDAQSAYVMRLAELARAPSSDLHVIAPQRLSRAEREFLAQYAIRAPVYVYAAGEDADDGTRAFAAAWPLGETEGLSARATALRQVEAQSRLSGRVRIAAATSGEHEACIVDLAVRERLLAGKRRIAIVVQDRITARRARALLERSRVLVADEAGWAWSTTSAATVMARWLEAVSGGFYHHDLLDVLKSPFAFADWPRSQRRAVVWRLEQEIRRENVVAGIDRVIALAGRDAEAKQMLVTLQHAAQPLQRNRATLAHWVDLLLESLQAIGVVRGWAEDAAGVRLLELLQSLREELRADTMRVTYGEWRAWLARELDSASFRDDSVDSPVVLTYLGAAALRRFEAVIIAGGDAAHLPGPFSDSVFFNDAVRAQLGLPTRSDLAGDAQESLTALMADCDDVVVTWQKQRDGEMNPLAPLLERLNVLHRCAYGRGLEDDALARRAGSALVRAADRGPAVAACERPAPRLAGELVPKAISASGHNALLACPYQFYVRYGLRLAETDEVQELIDKSDYGQCVHTALKAFHARYPRIAGLAEEEATRELERASDEAFKEALAANYLARAWVERWKAVIPDYLRWQRKRESIGWHVDATEVSRSACVETPAGRTIELRGRIDRVDANAEGAQALLDYKTQRRAVLRDKASADGEDVQLPFYALLWGRPVAEALFVGLERDGGTQALDSDVNVLASKVRDRLGRIYDALHEGARLPAHGLDEVCRYCEAAGLCRRSHWR
jgi:ATP-dependent helicase/nuclease subunit B